MSVRSFRYSIRRGSASRLGWLGWLVSDWSVHLIDEGGVNTSSTLVGVLAERALGTSWMLALALSTHSPLFRRGYFGDTKLMPILLLTIVVRWTVPIALTAGNCVILKPSEKVPLTMRKVGQLLGEAG